MRVNMSKHVGLPMAVYETYTPIAFAIVVYEIVIIGESVLYLE